MSSDTTDINGHTSLPENLAVNGILVVVSSPSGGGKGTLIRRALERVPNLGYSVSFTTRSPRQGEVDGRDYFFVSNKTFQSMVAAGDFLEWAVVHGNYYGTACKQVISELKAGNDIILEIDVQGAESIRSVAPTAVRVFILPPSFEVLKARLINRGTEVPSNLELRLRNSRTEVEHYTEFDYVVINDEADYAAAQLASIIIAERSRVERQRGAAARVLATFPTD